MRSITIRPFLLGVLGVLLAYLGQRALRVDAFTDAALLYGSGALLFIAAFWQPVFFPETALTLPPTCVPGWRQRQTRLAAALLLGSASLSIIAWRNFDIAHPASTVAWQQHIAAVVLALLAAACLDSWNTSWKFFGKSVRRWHISRALLASLILILLLAAFLRLWRLDSLPFGVWYDEAEYGLQALRILNDPSFRPVFEGSINGPAHYLYLVAGLFSLFGVSAHSIRLVNAAFGILTVLAGYVVGRELFGRRIGIVLAFLLAVSSWSVTLSRLGMHSTSTTPFFTLAALAFLLRSLRTWRMLDFTLAGLMLGLGLCFYTSFRLFLPVVGLFLLVYVLAQRRRTGAWPPTRFWIGTAILGGATALAVMPLLWFAIAHPDIFWSRIQDTFIFTGKSDAERLPVLLANIQKHLLMFNWRGDPNGRHNLPGAPMLDDISATLMVLGLAYSLRRLVDLRYALLPLWLGLTLLGGILSLDFEAPQSLRANGSLGAAYVLAIVPLAVLVRAWCISDGRFYPRWVAWPLTGLLALAGLANFNSYFDRQANDFSAWAAHSAAETLTANLLKNSDDNTDAFVTSFYYGHPTLRFLLPTSKPLLRLETTDQLPLDFVPGHGALLVMNPESHALYDAAKSLYPNATFTEVLPPMAGPPVLYTVRLSPQDVTSIQGLDGRYYANTTWTGTPAFVRRDAALDFDWTTAPALPEPYSVEWNGVLHVATYGPHDLILQGLGYTELYIGEQAVLTGTGILSGTVNLAEGNHALRVRAQGAPGRLQLRWRPPDRPLEIVGPGALYSVPMTAHGLLARYFPNGNWQGPQIRERIEDQLSYYVHVPPLPRPYTVEYTGKIAIPIAGGYRFGLESIDESMLLIDGLEVVRTTQPNQYMEGGLVLSEGLHDMRIRFADRTDHTHLHVYWMPPGATRTTIPAAVLFPPQASYANVELPALNSVVSVESLLGPPAPAPQLAGSASLFATGLQQPRGIAVGDDGRIYVAASGSGKVTIYSPGGKVLALIPREADKLAEPADVAIDSSYLYVLDAGNGDLWQFTLDGMDPKKLPVDNGLLGRGRGVALGPDGRLWVAATAAGVAAAIDPQTGTALQLPITANTGTSQPTDVAITADSFVYATDAAANNLVRLTSGGQLERSWKLPTANSLDGPHLAQDAQGNLYVSEPESGRVEKRDPSGETIGVFDVSGMLNRRIKAVGLAVGPDGRIWLTDSEDGAVIVVAPE